MRPTLDSKCRLCRAEGVKLYLKGARCFSPKCPFEKRGAGIRPGMHGQKRSGKATDYGLQLRAKQKAKRIYGVTETSFKNYFLSAKKIKSGLLGDNFLALLETRLDNLVYISGLSLSRAHARSLVSHKNILVNGKILNIPSYTVKVGDVISLNEKLAGKIGETLRLADKDFVAPEWLDLNKSKYSVKIVGTPTIDSGKNDIDVNLIIEYYSR